MLAAGPRKRGLRVNLRSDGRGPRRRLESRYGECGARIPLAVRRDRAAPNGMVPGGPVHTASRAFPAALIQKHRLEWVVGQQLRAIRGD